MDKKKIVFSNLIWRFMERCGAQGVNFIVSIVLARLLAPDVYGIVSLVLVFINILQVFVDSGLGNALIQKKDADELDFSTVFYFNIAVCFGLYLIMYVVAPCIAIFYNNGELIPIIRVLSLSLIISGIKNVQQAFVSRTMQFKRFFYSTLSGTIGSAILGIILAYCGFGVWALITQQLVNMTLDTIILWLTVRWRPKRMFSFERLKILLSFGWKLLVSRLINAVYDNIRSLIIGKKYSSADLAYYNRGRSLPDLFISNINTSIDSVLFPTMSDVQDSPGQVKNMARRAMKTSVYCLAPLLIGLAVVGKPLIGLLLTEKWLPCVPYMQIFCVTLLFYPLHTANLNAIKALGRSDLYLKMEIAKKISGIFVLIIAVKYGMMAMAYSLLISNIISQIINSWPNKKLLNYGYLEQLKDILPGIMLAVLMGCCVNLVILLQLPDIVTLMIQVPLGAIIYIGLSKLFKLDSFDYLWQMIKSMIHN